MTDLIEELKEDLKQEKQSLFIQKIIKIFFTVSAIIIVAISIYAWKEHTERKLQYELSEWYAQAIELTETEKYDEALKIFDKFESIRHQHFSALALLQKASLQYKLNRPAEAKVTLENIIKSKHFSHVFKDLAQITLLASQLEGPSLTSADTILESLTKTNKPWRLYAMQLLSLYKVKNGKIQEAQKYLESISKDKEANKFSQDSAKAILAVISRK